MIRLLYATILILGFCTISCKSAKKESTPVEPSEAIQDVQQATRDCYYPRKTIRAIDNEKGTIAYIADTYVIVTNPPERRYLPCELPTEYHKEGLEVRFSGDKLESFPNERRFASPFRMTAISMND